MQPSSWWWCVYDLDKIRITANLTSCKDEKSYWTNYYLTWRNLSDAKSDTVILKQSRWTLNEKRVYTYKHISIEFVLVFVHFCFKKKMVLVGLHLSKWLWLCLKVSTTLNIIVNSFFISQPALMSGIPI